MTLFQRLTRLTTGELAGLALLFNLPFAILQTQRGAFDTYVHIFLADHYRRSWFNLWEPRWYLGFSTASYPPLIHQLIALVSWPAEALVRTFSAAPEQYPGAWRLAGEEIGFVVVLLGVLALFPLAVRSFAKIFVGPRAATLGGLLTIVLPGLGLVLWSFGQLPSVTATGCVLAALSRGYAFLRHGRGRDLAQAVGLAAVTAATHHGVFLMVPFAGAAVTAHALLQQRRRVSRERKATATGWVFWLRLLAWGGLSAAGAAGMLWPFIAWSRGQSLQTPIDHLSRHSLIADLAASGFFFWPVYGPLMLALPGVGWAAARARGFRAAAPAVLALILFSLGLGGTTPLPKLLYGEGWEWLTYERFAFWAAAALLPLTAALLMLLARRKPLAAGMFLSAMLLAAIAAGGLSTMVGAQPPEVAMGPIVQFLAQPENKPYRYFTLGFGDQLARLSALVPNGTPDGTYHTARQLPELRESGIGAIDTVMWSSQAADAYPFLARAADYGARWAFMAHAHYEPVLRAAGWVYRFDVGAVQLWEKAEVRPVPIRAPAGLDGSAAAVWWGVAPLSALLLTGLALAEPRERSGWRAAWTRPGLARAARTWRLWGWGLTVVLTTLWWHRSVQMGETPWVYFIYQNAMVFVCDAAAAVTVGLWLIERGLGGGAWRVGPRWVLIGLGGITAASVLSLWQSAAPAVTLATAIHLGLLLAWYLMLVNDPPAPRLAGAVVVGLAAAQGLLALAQALTQSTAWLARLGLPWPGSVTADMSGASVVQVADGRRWLRAYGTLSHPNILGGFLLPGLALALERFASERGRFWLAAAGLMAAAGLLTFSRSAWLAAAVMALTAVWLWLPRRTGPVNWARARRWTLAVAAGLALVSLPVLPMVAARLNVGNLSTVLERRSVIDRLQLSRAAVSMFVDQPLTGAGAGAFVVRLYETMGVELPLEPAHNLPLLLAAEMGMPGLAALTVLAGAVGWRLWQRRRSASPLELALGAALVGMAAIGIFDHYWWTMPPARLMLVTVLGLWVGYSPRWPASER